MKDVTCSLAASPQTEGDSVFVMKRVLLVDDNPGVRKMLRFALESKGYTCEEAAHGAAALTWLEGHHADLVITDTEMPDLTGFQLLELLPQQVKQGALRIIMLSGNLDAQTKERAIQVGAFAVLRKPVNLCDLFGAVAEATHND